MKLEEIRGIAFPLRFDAAGRVASSSGEQHLKERIAQVLMTATGELPFAPAFGSKIPLRVFTPVGRSAILQADAAEAIRLWCPDIEVTAITPINTERAAAGQMGYAVTFKYHGEQAQTVSIGLAR